MHIDFGRVEAGDAFSSNLKAEVYEGRGAARGKNNLTVMNKVGLVRHVLPTNSSSDSVGWMEKVAGYPQQTWRTPVQI